MGFGCPATGDPRPRVASIGLAGMTAGGQSAHTGPGSICAGERWGTLRAKHHPLRAIPKAYVVSADRTSICLGLVPRRCARRCAKLEATSVPTGTNSEMAPALKLTYFDTAGRAEAIRLALCIGGVEFEDKRITSEEFPALKPVLPYGQLPVLEVNGEEFAQSGAVLQYVGKLTGLYPKDPIKALLVDEIIFALEDVTAALIAAWQDEEKRKECADVTMPKWMSFIEKRIVKWGGEWAAGDAMSIADLCLYNYWSSITRGGLTMLPATFLDPYTKIKSIGQKVADHPNVKKWNEEHDST